jgi:hypothetical protein
VGCLDVCLAPHGITGGQGVGTIGDIGDHRGRGSGSRWALWSLCCWRHLGAAKPPEFLGRDTKRPLPCPAGYQHPAAVRP